MMIKGQCLCGAITYLYHGEIEQSILCFCRDCQLAQGTIMAWNSALERSKFEICTGYQILKEYFHTPNKARVFCGICASPVFSYRLDLPDVIRLRLGTVTHGEIPTPKEYFYIKNKPDFVNLESG